MHHRCCRARKVSQQEIDWAIIEEAVVDCGEKRGLDHESNRCGVGCWSVVVGNLRLEGARRTRID